MRSVIVLCLALAALVVPESLRADIVYPARLELTESTHGIFDVVFTLPVINGKVLKARPILPLTCTPASESKISGNAGIKVESWSLRCNADSLYGKRIGIDGLQGSQVDILLNVRLLSGKTYRTSLSAVNAFYVIPKPMVRSSIIRTAIIQGMKHLLTFGGIYLLLVILLTFDLTTRQWLLLSGSFVFAHITGHWITDQLMSSLMSQRTSVSVPWLPVPRYLPAFAAYGATSLLCLHFYTGNRRITSATAVLTSVLIGASLGATAGVGHYAVEMSRGERHVHLFGMNAGLILATVLAFLLVKQGLLLIKMARNSPEHDPVSNAPYFTGILSIGLFLSICLSLPWNPAIIPPIPSELMVYGIVTAVFACGTGKATKTGLLFFSALSFATGIIVAVAGTVVQGAFLVMTCGLLIQLIVEVFDRPLPGILNLIIQVLTGFAAGTYLASTTLNTESYPLSLIMSQWIVICLITVFIAQLMYYTTTSGMFRKNVTLPLLAIGIVILFAWHSYYQHDFYPEIRGAWAQGKVYLPVLSLVILAASILSWPRHREIHRSMGLPRRKPFLTSILLVLAIALLPIGRYVSNPWYDPGSPDATEAKRIIGSLLFGVYTAFNLSDEQRLFTSLSTVVIDPLVDDLYLDSRRRLSTGLKEGSEVSVESVEMINVGEPSHSGSNADSGSYPIEWIVTARVRHLQHVHFRQNRYVGDVSISHDEGTWKISEIRLKSEERKVLGTAQ